jgi:hypothetical protein
MSILDAASSLELAQRLQSKANSSFDNAYRAALATEGATYVQGFLVMVGRAEPIEHAWIELNGHILDPSLPHLHRQPEQLSYFPAQRLSVAQLTAAVEEAKEDYPEDPPLPVYGTAPYAYYGDVMLGGQDYLDAFEAAQTHSQPANGSATDT